MLRPYLHVAAAMTHETMLLRLIALVLFLAALPVQAQVLPSFGQERTGGSGLQFLKVPVDARGAALSGTMAAVADDASALYWNPALAARGGSRPRAPARLSRFVRRGSLPALGISHSAAVGSRRPAQRANASASYHDKWHIARFSSTDRQSRKCRTSSPPPCARRWRRSKAAD